MGLEVANNRRNETELGEGLWTVALGITRISIDFPNMYTVAGDKALALIDTGWGDKEEIDAMSQQVSSTGLPLEAIITTHAHPDHIGGVSKILQLFPGVPIVDLSRKRKKVQTVELGGRNLTVFQSPGHTKDSKYAFDSRAGVIFTGDNVLGDLSADIEYMREYMDGIGALISLGPTIICPGHYESISGATAALLAVLRHREEREQQVLDALRPRKASTLDNLFDSIYGDEYKRKKRMAKFQIESHLIKLEEEGKVTKRANGWVLKK